MMTLRATKTIRGGATLNYGGGGVDLLYWTILLFHFLSAEHLLQFVSGNNYCHSQTEISVMQIGSEMKKNPI